MKLNEEVTKMGGKTYNKNMTFQRLDNSEFFAERIRPVNCSVWIISENLWNKPKTNSPQDGMANSSPQEEVE